MAATSITSTLQGFKMQRQTFNAKFGWIRAGIMKTFIPVAKRIYFKEICVVANQL